MVVSPKDNKGGGIVKKYNDTLIKMYIFLGLVVTTTRNHDGSSLMDQQWLNAICPITDTAVGPWVNLVTVP